jgi:hypothetical protein
MRPFPLEIIAGDFALRRVIAVSPSAFYPTREAPVSRCIRSDVPSGTQAGKSQPLRDSIIGEAPQAIGRPVQSIQHNRRAKLAAAAAAHAWAEGWHRGVIRPIIHVDRALVAAALAGHEEPIRCCGACCRASSGWFAIPDAKNIQGAKSRARDRVPGREPLVALSGWSLCCGRPDGPFPATSHREPYFLFRSEGRVGCIELSQNGCGGES